MTGAQLFAYVKRRLAESGLTLESGREDDYYDAISQARDEVKGELGLANAPVSTLVTLEVEGTDPPIYRIPAATADPLKMLYLADGQDGAELTPSSAIDDDSGDYAVLSVRRFQLARHVGLRGDLVGRFILHDADITSGTASADIGLPTPCHRAIGMGAAVLLLTADEESNAQMAAALYQRELSRLLDLYGAFDANGGQALRHAMMRTEGELHGDYLY
jgi:hypothetical protein